MLLQLNQVHPSLQELAMKEFSCKEKVSRNKVLKIERNRPVATPSTPNCSESKQVSPTKRLSTTKKTSPKPTSRGPPTPPTPPSSNPPNSPQKNRNPPSNKHRSLLISMNCLYLRQNQRLLNNCWLTILVAKFKERNKRRLTCRV